MNAPLDRRIALVTGASRGIGAAVAVELARAGADVVVNYCHSPHPAAAVKQEIEKLGRRALVVQADVACCAQLGQMFQQIEAQWGSVDILVNNAGIEPRATVEGFDETTYDAVMNTNLKGAFFCAQRAVGRMQTKGWGRIINISSIHEHAPTGFSSVYSMSKGGMLMMMREMAREFGPHGITVNNICPGAIRTDINRKVLSDPAYEARVVARIPAGFIGEPSDVAQLAAYLAADAARYITGASLTIDGGLTL